MQDFEMAKDKVLMGTERRSMVMSEAERRTAAWHEAGHTLVGKFVVGNDEVHKVTIIPRGAALGVTQFLPVEDRHLMTREQALARIAMALGGRIAEEIVFGEITTGASDDIRRATQIARSMVCEVGMSEKLGPIAYGEREESVFLGRDFAQRQQDYSEQTAVSIDEEIRRIVAEQHEVARKVLERSSRPSSTPWRMRSSSARRSTPKRSKPSSRGARSPSAPRSSSRRGATRRKPPKRSAARPASSGHPSPPPAAKRTQFGRGRKQRGCLPSSRMVHPSPAPRGDRPRFHFGSGPRGSHDLCRPAGASCIGPRHPQRAPRS